MSEPRVYAVGDIHGRYDQVLMMMQGLVDDGFDVNRDTVVFLGDYIDRGPKSVEVLQFVFHLRGQLGAERVGLVRGRLSFGDAGPAPFPSMIVVYNGWTAPDRTEFFALERRWIADTGQQALVLDDGG